MTHIQYPKFKHIALALTSCFISALLPVFAESAPVYDVEAMQQPYEMAAEQMQQAEEPMPPAAEQQENTFVPMQADSPVNQPVTSSSGTAEQRLNRLEQQLRNIQSSQGTNRIETLQTQVQILRGQVEHMLEVLEQVQAQQSTLVTDIDKRLAEQAAGKGATQVGVPPQLAANQAAESNHSSVNTVSSTKAAIKTPAKIEAAVSTTTGATQETTASQPNVAEEQQIYQTAYNLIKNKKYNDAVNVLQSMLQKYPSGQFASNAHYWLGELYGLLGKNTQALAEFVTVVQSYPDSPRVSDAQLKVGLIYAAELKWSDAKASLKKVINRYPGTTSARLASEQLKQIKQAGH